MYAEAADFLFQVDRGPVALFVVLLLVLKRIALEREVVHGARQEVGTDGDVAETARALALHNLDGRAGEERALALLRGEAKHGLENPGDAARFFRRFAVDADMANAFAESLGVKAEFIEINWDYKVMELDGQNIDCVWNGMTLTDEVKAAMEVSEPYCENAQVLVVPADKAADYEGLTSLEGLNVAVESGSAGEDAALALGASTVPVQTQADTLMEVAAGTSDAAVIDLLMAGAMIGEGTSYEDLTFTLNLNEAQGLPSEEYGVGFRKGSDLAAAFNEFWAEKAADGTALEIATTYGLQDAVILE